MEKIELKSEPDSELVLRYQLSGDTKAFSELYHRYHHRILHYCQYLLKSQDEAFDVSQDVFLRAMEKLYGLKNPVTFAAWLFSIARNSCIDRSRLLSHFHQEPDENQLPAGCIAEEPGEEEYLEKEERFNQVFQLLDNLSSESKQILVMKYMDNYSIEQIQAHFHIGESAVKMRLARAKHRVCAMYEKEQRRAMR